MTTHRRYHANTSTARRSAVPAVALGLAFVVSLGALPVQAGVDEAVAAYERGDFEAAFKEFSRLAKAGDAEGQYSLGLLYAEGQGVKPDPVKAATWYRAAAEQNYPSAQYALGDAYRRGHGVKQDGAEAAKWFKAAAGQGYTSAQYRLGLLYAEGAGVPRDESEATKWLEAAASGGHAEASRQLAQLARPEAGDAKK